MLQLWIFYYFNIVLIALKIQSAWKCINEVWILGGESDEDIYTELLSNIYWQLQLSFFNNLNGVLSLFVSITQNNTL